MRWKIVLLGLAIVVLVGGVLLFINREITADYKNIAYVIGGQRIQLIDGVSELSIAPGSASKIITRYFGNVAKGDFNGDTIPDLAFLLTQSTGGSGTFYYLVASLQNVAGGYTGTAGVLLGDRIAPQNTEFKNDMIVANYADRKLGESYSTQPSVGVSKYFKVIEGELREIVLNISEADARAIAERSCIKGGEELVSGGIFNENSKTWWFDANLNATQKGCNPACVVSEETKTAEINWRCTDAIPQESESAAIKCLPEQRNVDVCIEIYQPVCATVEIQCIKAPCNPIQETFSNSCNACKNSLVKSYIAGECMK